MPYDLINEAAELMNWHIDSNGKMDVCPRECPLPEDTRPLCTECTYKTVLHRIAALVDVVEMVRTTPVISGGFRYKTDYEDVGGVVMRYSDYSRLCALALGEK